MVRKRDGFSKQQIRAKTILRSLAELERSYRIPVVDEDRIWLIKGPAERVTQPEALADALSGGRVPERRKLADLLGGSSIVELDAAFLSGLARAIRNLESRRDLRELTEAGVAGMKRLRRQELGSRLRQADERLRTWTALLAATRDASSCWRGGPAPAPEKLVGALPLRLGALARWVHDPVELLADPGIPADDLLFAAAAEHEHDEVGLLAALLLGARARRRAETGIESILSRLPPSLAAAPALTGDSGGVSLCMLARGAAEDESTMQRLLLLAGGNPRSRVTRLSALAERVAVLTGTEGALKVLTSLLELGRPYRWKRRKMHAVLQRFVQIAAERAEPRNETESRLKAVVDKLHPDSERARAALPQILVAFVWRVIGHEPPVLADSLAARLAALGPMELPDAARCLPRLFVEVLESPFPAQALAAVEHQHLSLMLARPRAMLDAPIHASPRTLHALLKAVTTHGLAAEQDPALWTELCALHPHDVESLPPELFSAELPGALTRRAVRLRLPSTAKPLLGNHRNLRPYLDCLESLPETDSRNDFARAAWFIELFVLGRRWAPAVTVALLADATSWDREPDLSKLHAIAGSLGATGKRLNEALESWRTPKLLSPPPERRPLAAALGLSLDTLDTYLHFRRLSHGAETFSAEIRSVLSLPQRERAEAAYLGRRLGESELEPSVRARLEARLARLSDPHLGEHRLETLVRRTRRRLQRDLALLRRQGLEKVLEEVARETLGELLGRDLADTELPDGLTDALHLLHSENRNLALLLKLVDASLAGTPLHTIPENEAWLARAASSGVDVHQWLRGLDEVHTIGEEEYRVYTETSPFEALKMGSYFDTCLDIRDGMYANAAVVNAVEVNKHVVYARRRDGSVAARKLVGATSDGWVVGYPTYAHEGSRRWRRVFDRALANFAERCGLELRGGGEPEKLHGGEWYSDGPVPWSFSKADNPDEPPDGWPRDRQARWEWTCLRSLERGDVERLGAYASRRACPHEQVFAAAVQLLARHPAAALPGDLGWILRRLYGANLAALTELAPSLWERPDAATHLASNPQRHHGDALDALIGSLQARPESVRAVGRILQALVRRVERPTWNAVRESGYPHSLGLIPLHAGVAPLADLFRLLDIMADRPGEEPTHGYLGPLVELSVEHAAEIVHAAYLRDRDPAPLVRILNDGEGQLLDVVLAVAARTRIPGAARSLRRRLRASPSDSLLPLALALGAQREKQDGRRLLRLLEDRPDSLDLAAAVGRCGDPKATELARSLWVPPSEPPVILIQHWTALARFLRPDAADLAARRLLQRIRQSLKPDGNDDNVSDLVKAWALLDATGPHGKLTRLRGALGLDKGSGRARPVKRLFCAAENLRATLKALPARTAALSSRGDGACLSLDWYADNVGVAPGISWAVRDPDFETGWQRLIATADLELATAAASRWVAYRGQRGAKPLETASLLAVLLGQRFKDLPTSIADGVLDTLDLDRFDVSTTRHAHAVCSYWLERSSEPSRQAALLSMASTAVDYGDQPDPQATLALRHPDPRRSLLGESLLRALPGSDQDISKLLEHISWLLPPSSAEATVRRLLDTRLTSDEHLPHVTLFPSGAATSCRFQGTLLEALAAHAPAHLRSLLPIEPPEDVEIPAERLEWLDALAISLSTE